MPFTIPNYGDASYGDQAEPDSIDFNILASSIAGNGVISGCAVTAQGTPNMSVAVAAGTVSIGGTVVSVSAGTVTITTANSTDPRFDLIRVNSGGTLSALAGTASSNPVFPTPASTDIVLASVYVPANDTTISSTQIVDKRVLINSIPASLIDAKGDLIVGTADNTVSRLAAGTNGYVLTPDSSQTGGVKWAALNSLGEVQTVVANSFSAVNIEILDNTSVLLLRAYSPGFLLVGVNIESITGPSLTAPRQGRILHIVAEQSFDTVTVPHQLTLNASVDYRITGGGPNNNFLIGSRVVSLMYEESSTAQEPTSGNWRVIGQYDGDALKSQSLSQFASTSSSELAGVISDETGTGSLVFATSPTLTTPTIGTAGFNIAGSTSGSTRITTSATASGTVVIPGGAGTVATLSGIQTLTNKTINFGSNTITGTLAQFNTALSDQDFASLAGTETLISKTLNLGSNTITGTLAQFNTALSDQDFASLAGTETLSSKTINLGSNTVTGTLAQFNTALSDQDFASLAGTETLSNKTLTTPNIGAATGTSLSVSGALTSTAGTVSAVALGGSLLASATPAALTSTGTAGAATIPARSDHAHPTTGLSTSSGTETLTNKTINLGSNTVTGTLAQFNTALSDQDFASLAGTETLSNKTLTSPNLDTPSAINLTNATALPNSATSGTSTATANTLVLRDANTNFAAGTITATLSGAAPAGSLSGGTLAPGVTVSSLTSFGNSPTLVTPNIGAATGTNLSVSGALTSTAGTVSGTVLSSTGNITAVGTVSAAALGSTLLSTTTPAALTSGGTYGAAVFPARSDHSHPTTGLSTSSGTETLTNKTINFGSNTITTTLAQLSSAVSDATVASTAGTETFTNKTVNLGSNTITGTLAQFNIALSDQDFASLAGTETLSNKTFVAPVLGTATGTSLSVSGNLTSTAGSVSALGLAGSLLTTSAPAALSSGGTYGASAIPARSDHAHPTTGISTSSGTEALTNKTINLGSNTITGTLAQFNTALSDQDFASLAGTETLTNKTLTSPNLGTPSAINLTNATSLPNSATSGTSTATANTLVLRDASANFAAGTVTAALIGTASAATALSTARNFILTGDVAGTQSSDLATGVSIASTLGTTGVTAGNYSNPTLTVDAKGRITAASSGVNTDTGWKADVRVATTGSNITLSGGAPNNLDGITPLAVNDRILVKNQSAPAQNGIYVVSTLGTGTNGTWTRATDADTNVELAASAVNVLSGTANGGSLWTTNFKSTQVLGTDSVNWYQIVDSSGASFTGTVTSTSTISGALLSSTGNITATTGTISALHISSSGSIVASAGTISGALLNSTGNVTATGNILTTAGSISTSTGTVSGALLNSTGNVTATGSFTTTAGAITTSTGTVSGAALGGSLVGNTTPGTLSAAGSSGTSTTAARADHQHPTTGLSTSAGVETLTNKTFGTAGFGIIGTTSGTATVITAAASAGTIVLPGFAGTIATLFGTETLTNKTFVAPTLGAATGTSLNLSAGTITAGALAGSLLTTTAPAALTAAGTYGASTVPARSDHAHPGTASKLSIFGTTSSAELAGIITDETGTGSLVFGGSSTTGGGPALYNANLIATTESINIVASAVSATTFNIDVLTASVWYYTVNATGTATAINFRASAGTTLSSILAVGESMTVVFMQTNGATAYKPAAWQIDGSAFTPKWQGGTAPAAGNASAVDAYTFTIIKTAATPTYTVLGAQTKYA